MIAVIDQAGHPSAAVMARWAAEAGGAVELVARVRDDATGDRALLALSAVGVGHVATLRQPSGAAGTSLDAADLDLGLRYLADATTIVIVEPTDDRSLQVAADAAGFGGGTLIVVLADASRDPGPLPDRAIVLAAPAADPDEAFARLVGTLAARIDRGMDAAAAFDEATASGATWVPVGDDT